MAWKKFAKMRAGVVVGLIQSEQDEVDGMVEVTERDVRIGSLYDDQADTFEPPYAQERDVTKALVLMMKAAIQAGIIPIDIVPQEAKDIWQRVKENRQ